MFAGTHAYFSMEENRTCSVNYFCFGAVLIFIGSILLCALGFTVVLPFEATKLWYNTTCTVISADINETVCACDEKPTGYPGCAQTYPCLQIYVMYTRKNESETNLKLYKNNSNDNNVNHNNRFKNESHIRNNLMSGNTHHKTMDKTVLRHNKRHRKHQKLLSKYGNVNNNNYNNYNSLLNSEELTTKSVTTTISNGHHQHHYDNGYIVDDGQYTALLYRSWSDIFYVYCTLQECGDQEWNAKETRRFKVKWGREGQVFPCYVNPLDPEVVILNKTSFWAMLHAVLWPSTCLFVGVTLWLGLCCGCWKIDSESIDNSVPYYGVM